MRTPYSSLVVELLTYGDARQFDVWPNYLDLGLNREHVPELIRLATDTQLHLADVDSVSIWAPVHAWRALGQLAAVEAIEPLLCLFHELTESDWASEELPEVYGMIGPDAIPAITRYLADASHELWPRVTAARSLVCIPTHHPTARLACITALSQQLEVFVDTDPELNGFLVSYILDLKGIEALSVMEHAFAANRVDLSIAGDWEDVQIALGLKAERETPRPRLHLFPPLVPPIGTSKAKSSADKAAAKAKAKRKQAKASRKKNKQRK